MHECDFDSGVVGLDLAGEFDAYGSGTDDDDSSSVLRFVGFSADDLGYELFAVLKVLFVGAGLGDCGPVSFESGRHDDIVVCLLLCLAAAVKPGCYFGSRVDGLDGSVFETEVRLLQLVESRKATPHGACVLWRHMGKWRAYGMDCPSP